MPTLKIADLDRLKPALNKAHEVALKYLEKGGVELVIQAPSKSREMEKKYSAMIGDISKQVTFYKGKKYSAKNWKTQLIEQFAKEMRDMNEPLTHDSEIIMSLDGLREITNRPSSTDFRVAEAKNFIEYLYATGAEYNIVWSESAIKAYADYKEAQ